MGIQSINMVRTFVAVFIAGAFNAALVMDAGAQGSPLVILVRHAEKQNAPADDPSLTAAGTARAHALDSALASSGVTAIITTEFKRTRETAAPIAARRNLTVQVVPARGAQPAAHVQAVATAVRRHTGGVVLVVGHSNTIPAIIAALGGERMRDICDPDYDNLFILASTSGESRLVKSRFGAPDQVELSAPTCAAMRGLH